MVRVSDDDRLALRLFWDIADAHRDVLYARLDEVIAQTPAFASFTRTLTPDVVTRLRDEATRRQRLALVDNDWTEYLADAHAQGARYASLGVPFSGWVEVLRTYRLAIEPLVIEHFHGDVKKVTTAIRGADRFIDIAMTAIGESYLAAKEETIARQNRAILELSTPILQVRDRLLVVPLVGVLDNARARQLTENLLHDVRARRAKVVVLDVTGVAVVDSDVANHLAKAIDAASLMGARVIVSGISSEIARSMVTVGIDVRSTTLGDLQGALELADTILGVESHP